MVPVPTPTLMGLFSWTTLEPAHREPAATTTLGPSYSGLVRQAVADLSSDAIALVRRQLCTGVGGFFTVRRRPCEALYNQLDTWRTSAHFVLWLAYWIYYTVGVETE